MLAPGRTTGGNTGDLALLAHELTHVARQRQPGFVPPIVGTHATGDDEELAADAVALEDRRGDGVAAQVAVIE